MVKFGRVLVGALALLPLAAAKMHSTSARKHSSGRYSAGRSLQVPGPRALGRTNRESRNNGPLFVPNFGLGANPFAVFPTEDVYEERREPWESRPVMELEFVNTDELPASVRQSAFGQSGRVQGRPHVFGRPNRQLASQPPEYLGGTANVTESPSAGPSSTSALHPIASYSLPSPTLDTDSGQDIIMDEHTQSSVHAVHEVEAPATLDPIEDPAVATEQLPQVPTTPSHSAIQDIVDVTATPGSDCAVRASSSSPASTHSPTSPNLDVNLNVQALTSPDFALEVVDKGHYIATDRETPASLPAEPMYQQLLSQSSLRWTYTTTFLGIPSSPSPAHHTFGRGQASGVLPITSFLGTLAGAVSLLRATPLFLRPSQNKALRTYKTIGAEDLLVSLRNARGLEQLHVQDLAPIRDDDIATSSSTAVSIPTLQNVIVTSSSLPSLHLLLDRLQASSSATYTFELRLVPDIDIDLLCQVQSLLCARLATSNNINCLSFFLARSTTTLKMTLMAFSGQTNSQPKLVIKWRWTSRNLSHKVIMKDVVKHLADGNHIITEMAIDTSKFPPDPSDASGEWPDFGLRSALRALPQLVTLDVCGFAMPIMAVLAMPKETSLGDDPCPGLQNLILTDRVSRVNNPGQRDLLQYLYCFLRFARKKLQVVFVGRELVDPNFQVHRLMKPVEYTSIYKRIPRNMAPTVLKRPLYQAADEESEWLEDEDEEKPEVDVPPTKRAKMG
ncbi:unnamed protein product [Peniophora sp. CBMAI 1063]|nr:unnamed protein product [Peniophora sp. CBMAI 1063]